MAGAAGPISPRASAFPIRRVRLSTSQGARIYPGTTPTATCLDGPGMIVAPTFHNRRRRRPGDLDRERSPAEAVRPRGGRASAVFTSHHSDFTDLRLDATGPGERNIPPVWSPDQSRQERLSHSPEPWTGFNHPDDASPLGGDDSAPVVGVRLFPLHPRAAHIREFPHLPWSEEFRRFDSCGRTDNQLWRRSTHRIGAGILASTLPLLPRRCSVRHEMAALDEGSIGALDLAIAFLRPPPPLRHLTVQRSFLRAAVHTNGAPRPADGSRRRTRDPLDPRGAGPPRCAEALRNGTRDARSLART